MGALKGAKAGRETIHKIILNIVLSCQGKKATQRYAGTPALFVVAILTKVCRKQASKEKSHTQEVTRLLMDFVKGQLPGCC